ncbi:MAG: alpha/beta hydrolase [Sterolibacteriaceae bacterium]|nr:alpha/beta hydrolase [Sterolibacteriaceae bacterium]MBK9085509.1 alpha/beta hydrolase [Sterolibacteriaceae bacterium]
MLAMGLMLTGCGTTEKAEAAGAREVSYCTNGGQAQTLDLYAAEAAGPGRGTVIYIHGGGYTEGDKREGFELRRARILTKFGFAVASINYRLAPRRRFPAQLEDAKCAVAWVKANADARWIGLMGDSAGGHLASLIGVLGDTGDVPRVGAVAAFYAPLDLAAMEADSLLPQAIQPAMPTEAIRRKWSPLRYVSAGDPPFLLVHGRQDRFVSIAQSVRFAVALEQSGHDPLMAVVENADHGLFPVDGLPAPSPDPAAIDRLFVAFFVGHSKVDIP